MALSVMTSFGLLKSIRAAILFMFSGDSLTFIESDGDEVAAHNNTRKALIESLDQSMITPTPEVAPAKILDAIIAPF